MVTFQNVTPVYLIYFIVHKNSSFPISGYKKNLLFIQQYFWLPYLEIYWHHKVLVVQT